MTLLVLAAWAHQPGLSYLRLSADRLAVVVSRMELGDRVPVQDLDAGRLLIAEATLGRVVVRADGVACTVGDPTIQATEGDGVEVAAELDCPRAEQWTIDAAYVTTMAAGHRAFVEVDGEPAAVLDATHTTTSVAAKNRPRSSPAWVAAGIGVVVAGLVGVGVWRRGRGRS